MATDGPSGSGSESAPRQDAAAALSEAIESIATGAVRDSTLPEHLRHLPERERAQELDLKRLFATQEHELREYYATWILKILATELAITDAVFVTFAWVGEGWDLSPGVIEIWLAATVVQIVGIVLVVTRHLFPERDRQARKAAIARLSR